MSHLFSDANGDLQRDIKLRFLQSNSAYEQTDTTFNYFPIIYGVIIGFFVLMAICGLILRIRAMRRRRVHRPTPQPMMMGGNAGFQLSSSVSPQNYPQPYYPNQEQTYPYQNVSYPGYQNGVDPNMQQYGMQQPYNGGTYYQQNAYSGYVQQY